MIPVHRGTATSPRAFFRVNTGRTNELRVTGAVRALSAGGKEACLWPALLQLSSWSDEKQNTTKKKKTKLKKNATHYIKGSHCHGDQ